MEIYIKYQKIKFLWDRNLGFIRTHLFKLSSQKYAQQDKIRLLTSYRDDYLNARHHIKDTQQLKANSNFIQFLDNSIREVEKVVNKIDQEIQTNSRMYHLLSHKINVLDELMLKHRKTVNLDLLKRETHEIEELFRTTAQYNSIRD